MPVIRSRAARKPVSALDLLKADHAAVKKLFKQFAAMKKRGEDDGKGQVVQSACKALQIHARIEEEIFYPALREAANADDPLDEAQVEHSHVKELVAELQAASPGDELYDAKMKVLSEYVEHHVQEEESTLFSKARKAGVDLAALGEQLAARKAELGADDAAASRPAGGRRQGKQGNAARMQR
ncbi:MAG: hemerythrin domain-containing protein [Casimicrobiaceae bacterium]